MSAIPTVQSSDWIMIPKRNMTAPIDFDGNHTFTRLQLHKRTWEVEDPNPEFALTCLVYGVAANANRENGIRGFHKEYRVEFGRVEINGIDKIRFFDLFISNRPPMTMEISTDSFGQHSCVVRKV